MAGGDHDATIVATVERGKIHALGAAHADVKYIDATVGETLAHSVGETLAAQADVAADDHFLGLQELGVATCHLIGHSVIEFIGNSAA
jgi:hypothetical protein